MSLFRRSTIFHVEETLPDPEELKLRFRRRVLLCATAGFLAVLGAPVARDLKTNLHARAEARRFAERLLEARSLAAASRAPVALEMSADHQTWKETFYVAGEACVTEAPGPHVQFSGDGMRWKMKAQQANGTTVTGSKLCWHPGKGLLLDAQPLEQEGKLLVSLSASPEEGLPEQELASVLVTQGGAELQTISY